MKDMEDKKIHKDMTINDVMKLYPKTMEVINKYNVDSCCGGMNTVEKGAEDSGADLQLLLKSLEETAS